MCIRDSVYGVRVGVLSVWREARVLAAALCLPRYPLTQRAPPPAPTLARVGAGGGAFLRSDAPTLSQTWQLQRPAKRKSLPSEPPTIFTQSIICERSWLHSMSLATC